MAAGDFDSANELLGEMFGAEWQADDWGQQLLYEALYDRELTPDIHYAFYDIYMNYMDTNYDLDFEEWFDWDAYREWYDSQ